jgi:hypothetical protein
MTYEALEHLPIGKCIAPFVPSPWTLYVMANNLRLGHEIVRLAETETIGDTLQVSKRPDAGIGIDSDIPSQIFPREVTSRLGDYHRWPTLRENDWPLGLYMEDPEFKDVINRVTILINDDDLQERDGDRDQILLSERPSIHGIPGAQRLQQRPGLQAYDNILLYKHRTVTSEQKIEALKDQEWREYAKHATRKGIGDILRELQDHKDQALGQLGDIRAGEPDLRNAPARFTAIEQLLTEYVTQMRE